MRYICVYVIIVFVGTYRPKALAVCFIIFYCSQQGPNFDGVRFLFTACSFLQKTRTICYAHDPMID